MANSDVITFTDSNFETEVLHSKDPVLVDFWAVWCGPCRAIAPMVEELAREYQGKAKIGKLNVDENQQVAARFGIRSIPTLLVIKEGKVIDQVIGAVPKSKLVDALNKAM